MVVEIFVTFLHSPHHGDQFFTPKKLKRAAKIVIWLILTETARPSIPAAAELAVEDGVLHPLVVLGVSVALGLVLRLGRAPLAQSLGSLRSQVQQSVSNTFSS